MTATARTVPFVAINPCTVPHQVFFDLESAVLQLQWVAGGRGKNVVMAGNVTKDGWTIDVPYTKTILWGKVRIPWSTRTLRVYGRRSPALKGTSSYSMTWFPEGKREQPLKSYSEALFDVVSSVCMVAEVLMNMGFRPTLLESRVESPSWVAPLN